MKATTALSKALVASVLFGGASVPLLLAPSPLGHDLPPVSPSGRHQKKVAASASANAVAGGAASEGETIEDEGPWPVLATLVNIHTGEVVVLDEQGPTIERWWPSRRGD
ncbi:MAG: hypothetical protein EOO74_02220 [Myxococcales bacterium]|nr:MAG: hypothetical protein EOO74_02220 [Myxococcales bacterium]